MNVRRRGFTLIEMLVSVGIGLVLLSILVPYVLKAFETSRRTGCAEHLRQIYLAMVEYAKSNNYKYPRVVYDQETNPNSYTAFTGVDDPNPFAPDTAVSVNDVTASLWLLVRHGFITDTSIFVCPSAGDSKDRVTDSDGRAVKPADRSNFRRSRNLSYSYTSPFSSAEGYRLDYDISGGFVLMADRNPGENGRDARITSTAPDAPPLVRMFANSRNHGRAGQNVLFAEGTVKLMKTPWCGVGGDNIYTAAATQPATQSAADAYSRGHWSNTIGPSWHSDSYLVPTALETQGKVLVRPVPVTQPTSAPASTTSATQP